MPMTPRISHECGWKRISSLFAGVVVIQHWPLVSNYASVWMVIPPSVGLLLRAQFFLEFLLSLIYDP